MRIPENCSLLRSTFGDISYSTRSFFLYTDFLPYTACNIHTPKSAADKAGTAIILPYFIKLGKEKSIPWLFTMFIHIIPAKAPTGVKTAPRLLPMTVANNAPFPAPAPFKIAQNSTLMGILFNTLQARKDAPP